MSKENVIQFLSVASSDAALQDQLAAASDSESLVRLARSSGYSFTMEDLQAVIIEQNYGEFSAEDLEEVAGGSAGVPALQGISHLLLNHYKLNPNIQ